MGHNGPIGSDSFQKSLCESNFLFLSELHQSDLIKLRKQSLPRYNENHSLFVTIVQLVYESELTDYVHYDRSRCYLNSLSLSLSCAW